MELDIEDPLMQTSTLSVEGIRSDLSMCELLERERVEIARRSLLQNTHNSVVEYFQQLDMTPILPHPEVGSSPACTSTPLLHTTEPSPSPENIESTKQCVAMSTTKQSARKNNRKVKAVKRNKSVRMQFREILSKGNGRKTVFKRRHKLAHSPPLCVLAQPCLHTSRRQFYYNIKKSSKTGTYDVLTQ